MKLSDFLIGYKPDVRQIQQVGNMIVLPILSEQEFTQNFEDVDAVQLKHDHDYGRMEFCNSGSKIGILMQGATILTRQRAQDRTVPRTKIFAGKAAKEVDVYCVQPNQSGHINLAQLAEEYGNEVSYKILAPGLRSAALEMSSRHDHSFSQLWQSIERYSQGFGGIRRNLISLYDENTEKLNQFVAQFEPVHNQVGAVVFINNNLVAVDFFPTYRSWSIMWRTLLRDSYGMEALRLIALEGSQMLNYKINLDDIATLDDLETAMNDAETAFIEAVRNLWAGSAGAEVHITKTDRIAGAECLNIECGDMFGQTVIHDNHCVYMSLVPKGSTYENKPKFKRSNIYGNDQFGF